MEMQIPHLRQLFESRVGQISNVLATDPPAELGKIDPTMRGLKGFLFALEGMLRQNELQHMPFTARAELFDRVDQAIELLKTLPASLDGEQALGVLRVMDNLHRLCLQESLMASGLDASKLGRLTVILERKLGEVLDTIDEVAETGQGRAGQIEQATQERLAQIQGTYKREAEVLSSSASSAVESIRTQAETIHQKQADAMKTVEALHGELRTKRQQCQAALDEQLSTAGSVVAKIRGEQQAVTNLLARAREQLDSTQAAIKTMAETVEATESARGDLKAKLSEGRDVIGSMHKLLETSTQAAGELAAKVTQAQEGLASIEQTAAHGAAAREAVAAAEKMLRDVRQSLDAQFEASTGAVSEIQAQRKTVDDAVEQTLQQQQATEQTAAAAAETLRQAGADLTQFRALLTQGHRTAEQLDQLAQTGNDLKARVTQTLDGAQERIGQVEAEAAQAASAIQEGKGQALSAARDAVDEAERLQRQFAQSLSDQREAARNAVAALRGDQAIGADLLGRAQQDIETLAAEVTRIGELRSAAGDTEAQVRQKLDQVSSVVTELEGMLVTSRKLKSQIDGDLAESTSVRARMENMLRETAAAIEDLRRQQDQALGAMRDEAAAAEAQRKTSETALGEQLNAAAALVADLRTRKETADALLAEISQQRDAAHAAAQASGESRVATAQATGEVQASLVEARRTATDIAGLLAGGAETRSKIDTELAAATKAAGQADEFRRKLDASFARAEQQGQDIVGAGEQSQQLITDLRSNGQEALAELKQQNTELAARSAELQREFKDFCGAAADGGLFRQFDELAQQSAPQRAKWLRRTLVSGVGGGTLLATVSSILTIYSLWAAGAVLAAGLLPLGFFMHLCVSQYSAARRAESEYQYRAALSRSLTAYRKLLSTMQAEGIADSTHVDRMLSALFGASTQPVSAAQAPETKTEAHADLDTDASDVAGDS